MTKTLRILVAALLLVSLLAGCSTSQPTATTNPATEAPATDASTTPPTEQPTHKLKLLGSLSGWQSDVKFDERSDYFVWQAFEQKLKEQGLELTFEAIAADQYNVTVQTRMASGSDLPDFVNLSPLDNPTCLNLAKQGILLPINKILDENGGVSANQYLTDNFTVFKKLNTTPDGNVYWITNLQNGFYQDTQLSTQQTILIRWDWLQKAGLGMPASLDEFTAALKAFRDKDVNASGVADEVLFVDPQNWCNGVAQWFGLAPALTSPDLKKNKIVSPWYQPGVKEYFSYLKKLADEELLDKSLIGAGWEKLDQRNAENKLAAECTYALETWREGALSGVEKPELAAIQPVVAMQGVDTTVANCPGSLSWGKWSFTKNCTDLTGAAKLINILYSSDYMLMSAFGVEGKSYDMVAGKPVLKAGIDNTHLADMAANKTARGDLLFDGIFPRLRVVDTIDEVNQCKASGFAQKADMQIKLYSLPLTYTDTPGNFLSIPSDAELDEKGKILADLNTYSNELATKLVLGTASLNNWDEYIANLKKLGLDRLIEIEQAQMDRFLKY